MVRTNKDVVMYTRDDGKYPLRTAIRCGMDPRIISILIDENGELLRRRNYAGMLPVCVAIKEGCHVDVLKLLVYPDCLDVYDQPPKTPHHELPLHMAVLNPRCSLEVVEFLVQLNKAALFKTTYNGETALHLAAGRQPAQNLDVLVIQFLAQQAPATRTMLSLCGRSPF